MFDDMILNVMDDEAMQKNKIKKLKKAKWFMKSREESLGEESPESSMNGRWEHLAVPSLQKSIFPHHLIVIYNPCRERVGEKSKTKGKGGFTLEFGSHVTCWPRILTSSGWRIRQLP